MESQEFDGAGNGPGDQPQPERRLPVPGVGLQTFASPVCASSGPRKLTIGRTAWHPQRVPGMLSLTLERSLIRSHTTAETLSTVRPRLTMDLIRDTR